LGSGVLSQTDVIIQLATQAYGRSEREVGKVREFSDFWQTQEGKTVADIKEMPDHILEKVQLLVERLPALYPRLWQELKDHEVFSKTRAIAAAKDISFRMVMDRETGLEEEPDDSEELSFDGNPFERLGGGDGEEGSSQRTNPPEAVDPKPF